MARPNVPPSQPPLPRARQRCAPLRRSGGENGGGPAGAAATERGTLLVFATVHWGDRVLRADAVRPGRPLSVGERPGDLYVPGEVLGADHLQLVTFARGEPVVHLPRCATGSITLGDGTRRSIEPLRPPADLRHMAPPETRWVLPVGATLELAIEPLTIAISRSLVDHRVLRRPAPPIDRRVVASCAAAAIPVLGLLATAANALPLLGQTAVDELAPAATPFVVMLGWDAAQEQERAPALSTEADPRDRDCPAQPGVPCRCRPNGELMGDRYAEREGHYAVIGPRDNPDPHIARSRLGADDGSYPQVVGFRLVPPLVDRDAPVAPWGRDDALGTDPLSTRGAMWADVADVAPGTHDLGIEWPADGLVKSIEPADEPPEQGAAAGELTPDARAMQALAEPANARAVRPRVVHANLFVDGLVAPSKVLPAMANRLPAALGCYRAAIVPAPELRARITVVLSVPSAPDSPVDVHLETGTPAPTALVACLERAYAGIELPRPPEGLGIVRYPLYLLPAKE